MSFFKTEKEFEDQFYQCILAHKINPLNGRPVLGVCRQATLGSYGIADIITLEDHAGKEVINVIELKNVAYHSGMVFQVGRYMEAVKLGSDYSLILSPFTDFDVDQGIITMFPSVRVIGSLVCTSSPDMGQGERSVYNALSITVYSAEMHLLQIHFDQINCESDRDTDQIRAIQSTISGLANPIEAF